MAHHIPITASVAVFTLLSGCAGVVDGSGRAVQDRARAESEALQPTMRGLGYETGAAIRGLFGSDEEGEEGEEGED